MRKVAISFLALCAALVASWQLSSIDIPHFKSLHVERLLVSPAHAQFNGCAPGFCGSVAQLPLTGGGFAGGRGSCTFPSLSGLIGRYLASNATVSGGNVTGINDSSGAGNNLTVTGTVPYAATGYNGHPAFNFVGTGALINTSFPFGTGNSTTFYAATNINSSISSIAYAGLFAYAGAGHPNDYDNQGSIVGLAMNNETAEVDTQFNNQSVTTVNISYGTNYRFGAIQDGDAFAVYLNGSSAASSTYSDGLTLISNGNLVLGGRYNSSAFTAFWYGPVPEFDVMNADNTANISALDTYFTCAYGS